MASTILPLRNGTHTVGVKDYGIVARMDRIVAAGFADAGNGLWTWRRVGDRDFDAGNAYGAPAHLLVNRASSRCPPGEAGDARNSLKALREKYATNRQLQMQKTLELYQQHGIRVTDGKSLLGACMQMPLVLGLYQTLRNGVGTTAFLWIRNLARPDVILAILAAVTTAVAMAVAPNMPEHMRWLLILLPAVFCLLTALHLSSGIALYWITTNTFGAAHTIALRRVVKRRGL
jgi:YidC/Oxa1 family membrane protein insertase